jgi:uncharacterized protein (DUF1800 family)
MPDTRSLHAMIRFGYGRRGDEPLPADPIGWLVAQLDGPDPALALPGKTTPQALAMLRRDTENDAGDLKRTNPAFDEDTSTTMNNWLTTDTPFRERLVWFWANHFTVSLRAHGDLKALVPSYVRDAIRPHVTGRFTDMLAAVMHHPAMLYYLDNIHSAGPDSAFGRDHGRGLNENLARESLELHTVTAESGYTQRDVTEYAKVLTGWTYDMHRPVPGFQFRADLHQPGEKTVLGRTLPEGEAGGRQMLAWLGEHPRAYRSIATKLTRHFVADDPPDACIHRVETVLRYTGGDLRAAAMAVIALPEAWQPATKFRAPMDYVVAVLRALGIGTYHMAEFWGALAVLGQIPLTAPMPNGFPDTAAAWGSGEGLLRAIDWVHRVTPYRDLDPEAVAQNALGRLVSANTMRQVFGAETPRDGLMLVLTSPEFMRR